MLEACARIAKPLFSADGKKLSVWAYVVLALVCFGFFAPGFTTLPPTDRDESSFAQASKQMVESGNYTDIRLQKEPRYKKPIGIYWLQSTAVRILNPQHLDEIWAYRVPSFLGATLAVLMTAALGALLFNPATGLLAGVMLAGCVLMNVEARLAKTDAALLGCIVTAMYALAQAYLGRVSKWRMPLLFWTAFAVGVLIKGPIILLPIAGVLLWGRISDKNVAWFRSLRPALGLIYALALIAPWFVIISLQSHGAFFHQSAGNDMFAKLWQGQNRGMLPPGMHLMALPIVFFPFSLFVLLALPDMWKNRKDTAVKFCLGWILPAWVVFEFSMTKLPHYVLPVYPALTLLTAKFLLDGLPTVAVTKRRLSIALVIGLWLMIGAGFAFLFAEIPVLSDHTVQVPAIMGGCALVLAQLACLVLLPKDRSISIAVLTFGTWAFLAVTFGATLPQLQHVWLSREIVRAVAPIKPCPQSQLVSVGYHEPSLAFLAGTDTVMLSNSADAARTLQEDDCRVAVVDLRHKQEFIDAFANAPRKPQEGVSIGGLNSGHGGNAALTVFTLPKVQQ